MVKSRKTDVELIESLRVRRHWRRPVGAALIGVGACTFFFTRHVVGTFAGNLERVILDLNSHTFSALANGQFIYDAFSATNTAAYLGGKAMAQGTLLGMLLVVLGVIYAFGTRREDELLIRYHEQFTGAASQSES
jgi:hypothetical protein